MYSSNAGFQKGKTDIVGPNSQTLQQIICVFCFVLIRFVFFKETCYLFILSCVCYCQFFARSLCLTTSKSLSTDLQT